MLAWSLGKTVKDACLVELAEFQADLTTNVNKDIPLGEQLHILMFTELYHSDATV